MLDVLDVLDVGRVVLVAVEGELGIMEDAVV